MKRIAFKMRILPGMASEYKRRHDEIWPDLSRLLRQSGISNYSIFLEESSGELFAVLDSSDPASMDRLPENQIMQKWWSYMSDIMSVNSDNSPVTVPLNEVFHLS